MMNKVRNIQDFLRIVLFNPIIEKLIDNILYIHLALRFINHL